MPSEDLCVFAVPSKKLFVEEVAASNAFVDCLSIPEKAVIPLSSDDLQDLKVTRCYGYPLYQCLGLSWRPEIRRDDADTKFYIIASDGFHDYMSPAEAVEMVWQLMDEGKNFDKIAEILVEAAARADTKNPSRNAKSFAEVRKYIRDDMTVLILAKNPE